MENFLKLLIFILIDLFPTLDTANPYLDSKITLDVIFPGTKWCGPGNVAKNFDDLGSLSETDKCCRYHDYCPLFIEAGGNDFGLNNPSDYTRLLCACDESFRQCLLVNVEKKRNALSSEAVGLLFFDHSQPQCLKKEHIIIRCKVFFPSSKRCKEYELDMASQLTWQWFDDPLFYD